MSATVSIIIPAKNEALALNKLLPHIKDIFPDHEIVVINDGSVDKTEEVCRTYEVSQLYHPYSMGNGASIKTGARHATGDILVFLDADGQHDPEDIPRLLEKLGEGYDMVVGAREYETHAGVHRALGNSFFNRLSSWMVGHKVDDLTSGFRVVRKEKFRRFLHLLPNGFSYPTTITMSFFRAGFPIAYIPIQARQREGKSHIRLLRDGTRFMLIILRIGTLYSPFRLFLPVSLAFFLTGLVYYMYTFMSDGRFTNMSALMFSSSIITFLIGVVSEQITALHYKDTER